MSTSNSLKLDPARARALVAREFDTSIIPTLIEYIRIPNKSPSFDAEWQEHGHMEKAVSLLSGWAGAHAPKGMEMEIVRLPGRTPLIFMDIPATATGPAGDDTVLLYGHLDKQPEMTGWDPDKGPWIPVRKGDRLYGRGGADDGYSIFASLTAINALDEQGVPRARCVVLIEACEESGSYDLPHYLDTLMDRIGVPSLVVCLDSGSGNYDQLWCTTSLRGMLASTLRVDILREGVHSGDASGVVASSFRIMRQLLSRLEDPATGTILPEALYVAIPRDRIEQAALCAQILGNEICDKYPFVDGACAVSADPAELLLNRTWRPALSVTGADGMPPVANAGNVLRPFTTLKLSMRLPPTLDAEAAAARIKTLLEKDPPYGAKVSFSVSSSANGWNAPPVSPWLAEAMNQASRTHFDRDAAYMGEGGTIPFMGILGEAFPEAQFLITGVLGPQSNAHGPNEFLHIPMAQRLTCCVSEVLAAHVHRPR